LITKCESHTVNDVAVLEFALVWNSMANHFVYWPNKQTRWQSTYFNQLHN